MARVRIVLAVLLLLSSSLALGVMTADAAVADTQGKAHIGHQHGEAEAHEDFDCHMALCCFALPAAELVEPMPCALILPRPGAVALLLSKLADPHERPPQQV